MITVKNIPVLQEDQQQTKLQDVMTVSCDKCGDMIDIIHDVAMQDHINKFHEGKHYCWKHEFDC